MNSDKTTHTLTLNNVTGNECVEFLKRIEPYANTFVWHINGSLSDKNTVNVYMRINDVDLTSARLNFSAVATKLNMQNSQWQLYPDRI